MQDAPKLQKELAVEIADRLRPVCPRFTEEELQALASRMAALQLKYERRVVLDFTGGARHAALQLDHAPSRG